MSGTLGEPVLALVRALEEAETPIPQSDMPLLTLATVADMSTINEELVRRQRPAAAVWAELAPALRAREAELAARRERLEQQQSELSGGREEARREAERIRHNEKQHQEHVEAGDPAAEEEETELERRRAELAAREAELAASEGAIAEARARLDALQSADQRRDWAAYVESHPLEEDNPLLVTGGAGGDIAQQPLTHLLNAPPKPSEALLRRAYTPACPRCATRYTQPPPQWECPLCMRRDKLAVKVWQPDEDSQTCMLCAAPIARFSRHHCRRCGRLTCSRCCNTRALIAGLGYQGPVKVCDDCAQKVPRR